MQPSSRRVMIEVTELTLQSFQALLRRGSMSIANKCLRSRPGGCVDLVDESVRVSIKHVSLKGSRCRVIRKCSQGSQTGAKQQVG